MIKVAITDADTLLAGELVRLLVNHPDVEILGLVAPSHTGERADTIHHGLIGEPVMRFCSELPRKANAIFHCGNSNADDRLKARAAAGEIKIIDLSRSSYAGSHVPNVVPAISEVFRKPLVRGASEARVLSPLETTLVIALFPLARNLMLSAPLKVNVTTSGDVFRDLDADRAGVLASGLLQGIQQSYDKNVEFIIDHSREKGRGLRLSTTIKLAMPVTDVKALYDDVYDDHNFTFLTCGPRHMRDVVGTNKCLIYLHRTSDDELAVEALADARMRGWAGEAVLAMNLMFGLYERTGLQLKASSY